MTDDKHSALKKRLLIALAFVVSPISTLGSELASHETQSTIRVPIEIKTAYTERMFNEWLTGEFPQTEDCRNGDKKLKNCSYTITQAGPATVQTSNDRMTLTVPLSAAGKGKYKPTKWSSVSCKLSAHANIEVALSPMIDDQWQIRLDAQVRHQWRSKPKLKCGFIKATVTSKLDQAMTKAVERIESKLNEPFDIKPRLKELIAELQTANKIRESSDLNIQFLTEQLSYTGLQYKPDSINTLIALDGYLHLSDRTDLLPEKAMSFDSPPQMTNSNQVSRLVVNTSVNKESLEAKLLEVANRELSKSEEGTLLGFYPQLTDASISSPEQGILTLDLQVTPYCHIDMGCMDTLTTWFGPSRSQLAFSLSQDGALLLTDAVLPPSQTDGLHMKVSKIFIKEGTNLLISDPVTLLDRDLLKQVADRLLNREVGEWGFLAGELQEVKIVPPAVASDQVSTKIELIASSKLISKD